MQDALGTTIGMVEKDGRVSSRYHYDEFGIPLDAKKFDLNWPGPDNLFGYTGLGFDYTSGLSYARARYYEPEIGRFVSENTYEGSLWSPQSQNIYAYVANNPLKYVDPSGHIPTAMEAAKMAQDIYSVTDKDKGKIVINKWKLDNIIKNDEGLKMGVYSSVKADGTTEYALVNKGTTPSKMGDWVNNIQQPFGYSDDMKDSISKSEYFVANHKNAEITMVGHSKGGAEALANAVANNKNAITFNPADPNLIQYDLSKKGYKGNATNYVVSGEILNWALGEASVGKTKYLPIQHKWTVWEFLTKGADEIIDKRIQNHSMDSVISALKGEG
ncbi:hypothetical protein HMSSN139_28430 [Paenibacillus sp. HMSSN-139]|nr:hypothetical protein HMSSN139_28430 [Paenibacillus sp. HMSSN-139]